MTGTNGMQSGQDAPEGAEALQILIAGYGTGFEESGTASHRCAEPLAERAARGVGNAPNTQRQDTETDLIPAEVGAA
jgi:hypothetical protein